MRVRYESKIISCTASVTRFRVVIDFQDRPLLVQNRVVTEAYAVNAINYNDIYIIDVQRVNRTVLSRGNNYVQVNCEYTFYEARCAGVLETLTTYTWQP